MNELLSKMHAVLTEHDMHAVHVGGAWTTTVKTVDASKSAEELGWSYLGFNVKCVTCGNSLSREWNGEG